MCKMTDPESAVPDKGCILHDWVIAVAASLVSHAWLAANSTLCGVAMVERRHCGCSDAGDLIGR